MRCGMGVKTFEELFAWQCCRELRDRMVATCSTPALQKDLDLRNQLRKSSSAAPRLIAEGFGRFGNREFRRYLSKARAERMEVQNDIGDLAARHLVTNECITELQALAERALRVTTRLRSSLKDR
jgi:four helix bundle protein